MAKIKAYTSFNEYNNTHSYAEFEIVDRLPEVNDVIYGDDDNCISKYYGERERVTKILNANLDYEQPNDRVYEYDYFEVHTQFEEYDEESDTYKVTDEEYNTYYYAVRNESNN